jgi:hypothetical protein
LSSVQIQSAKVYDCQGAKSTIANVLNYKIVTLNINTLLKTMKLKLFTIATLSILGLTTCEKTPDPCAAMKPVSADFSTSVDGLEMDTFWMPASVTFKAKDSTAQSYEWSFPDGINTSNKRSFSLLFANDTGKVDVQLILKSKPQTACFPKDDGIDTVKKTMYFFNRDIVTKLSYIGTFVGTEDINPTKKFEIHIKYFDDPDPEPIKNFWTGVRIFNLPEGCGNGDTTITSYSPPVDGNYKAFTFGTGGLSHNGCPSLGGKGIMINKDKIVIDYSFIVWNGAKKNYDTFTRKFTGYRKK